MNLIRPPHHRVALFTLLAACCFAGDLATATAVAVDLSEATALYRAGKYAECVEVTAKAIAADEFSEDWRIHKIEAEMALGRYADALATLDTALERFKYSIALRWHGQTVCRFNERPDRAKQFGEEIVELLRQAGWRYRDSANMVVLGRFYLSQGMDAKKVLDGTFNDIKKRQPNYVAAYLASGQLALSKHDYALAAEVFQQAVKLDATDPEAYFGLAKAYAASDSDKAQAALDATLERNPRHVECLLFIAAEHIDSERYQDAEKVLDQV
ncbi:MAG: tetratricopeptide repeat protein, partial [Pirellulales bacterium]